MNTRRVVLHLIVGLLAFLLGVAAAMALGGFNPLERLSRTSRRHYTIPPQSLSDAQENHERLSGCRYSRTRVRTAEMHSHDEMLIPVAPIAPIAPLNEENVPPPPAPPSVPRSVR